MTTLVIAVSLSILISAICSLLESLLYSTRAITLEVAVHQGNRKAEQMRQLKSHVDRPLATILVLNTLANTAGASLAGWAAAEVWGAGSLWVFSLAFTLAILIFSEIIPKTIGAVHWRTLWTMSVFPLRMMIILLRPVTLLTQALTLLITRGREKVPKISEEEILAAARMGAKDGEISQLEHELINNIIQLEELRASDIMTPRTVMFSANGGLTVSQARLEAKDWPHTRVPIFLESPEEVKGYVIRDEVINAPEGDTRLMDSDFLKPVRFVPGSVNALNLLNSFLRKRDHFYLVVDEYGGIMGLVGLEDVLESLVGAEIVDEHEEVADLQEMARQRGKKILGSEESLDF